MDARAASGLLRQHVRELADWFDARAERERIQLTVAGLAVLLAIWLLALHQPAQARRGVFAQRAAAARDTTAGLQAQARILAESMGTDPVGAQRAEIERLERETDQLATRLGAAGKALLPPREITALLGQLLAAQPDLHLVRVESEPPVPLGPDGERAGPEVKRPIYRHGVEIEIEGSYLPTLRWLQVLENLPWRLQWDSLDYEVIGHPKARVRIRLHTLGLEEAWIRA